MCSNIVWLINFKVNIFKNGRKDVLAEKKTKSKLPLMFFDVQVVTGR